MSSVLIFRTGSLGDTLIAVPSLWRIREHFRDCKLTLLCDTQPGQRYVLATDLLAGSGLVDDFLLYPLDRSPMGRVLKYPRLFGLLAKLRARRFDTLVYLIASGRTDRQLRRDERFFRTAGIRNILGIDNVRSLPTRQPDRPLEPMPSESTLLLERMKAAGITGSPDARIRFDIGITDRDEQRVEVWRLKQPNDGGRTWIAVAPGSRMPAKVWPAERYERVVRRLIERFDVWPVVFGDASDAAIGRRLVVAWGRGAVAAGELGVRAAVAAIGRCRLYLGNDTGTMHMAASAGVRCVAVFCSHAPPGLWYPLGDGHQVFRTPIDCEGCGLKVCTEQQMACILSITPEPVAAACERVLAAPGGTS
jgi:ADP-heptose:LPS heptosyltransferase